MRDSNSINEFKVDGKKALLDSNQKSDGANVSTDISPDK